MAAEWTEKTSHDALALSHQELCRLLEQKERESNLRLAQELSVRCQQIQFHDQLTEQMAKVTDLFELGRLIVEALRRELGAGDALLAVVTETQFLEVVASTAVVPPRYQLDLIEEAFIAGEILSLSAADEFRLQAPGSEPLPEGVSLLAVPLFRHDEKPLGVLLLEGTLDPERREWLPGLLSLISLAIEDCLHYNAIESLIFDAALALALHHEAETPQQKGHARRVEELARQLARQLGLGATEEKHVRLLALIHDLTPEQVTRGFAALRRAKATAGTWKELMGEPFVGGIYASPLANFQLVVEELASLRCRWDGKGNQPVRTGDEIPLAARIVAVAEAFENLTGHRRHRTTLSVPAAIEELTRYEGTVYDPQVIQALRAQFTNTELEGRVTFLPDLTA